VAFAASLLGIHATVVVPEGASSAKVASLRRFPISLITFGANYDVAEQRAKEIASEAKAVFISPYNDVWVMAGQATIGEEILEDCSDLDVALVPIGGGGLVAGIGSVLKERVPGVRVIGVQAEASPSMERALKAGRVVEIPVLPTLADGLAANIEPDSQTFHIAREVVDEISLVSEQEIAAAIRASFHELHLALEGSAVVGIAALLNGKIQDLGGKQVVVVITGRNVAADTLVSILGR
jgi:threonine dehydratase